MESRIKMLFSILFCFAVLTTGLSAKPDFIGNIFGYSIPNNFDEYWDQVTSENAGKWGSVESSRDNMNWNSVSSHYNRARSKGYPFRFHVLVWGNQQPGWISGLSQSEQRAEVEEWIKAVGDQFDPNFVDVVNEPLHAPPPYKEALGGDGSTGWDWVITAFEMARKYLPNSQLHINEYGIVNDGSAVTHYLEIINLLKSRNLVDGIGVQAHCFNVNDITSSTLRTNLDRLGATGLPIYVTELDIQGDDNTQLARFENVFPVLYNHESVKGITLWGYIVGETWKSDTGLVYGGQNGASERPAMSWLKSYLKGANVTPAPPENTPTPDPNFNINVRAKGTKGGEIIEVQADGIAVDSFLLTTEFNEYKTNGSGQIAVHFTNDDQIDMGMDVQIDYLIYNGVVYEAEAQETNTGVWQDGSCGGSFSEIMHCGGYILFADTGSTPGITPTPDPGNNCTLKGDVNGDNQINIVDALLVAQHYTGLPVNLNTNCADINCNGRIEIVDALIIAQIYVGLINPPNC